MEYALLVGRTEAGKRAKTNQVRSRRTVVCTPVDRTALSARGTIEHYPSRVAAVTPGRAQPEAVSSSRRRCSRSSNGVATRSVRPATSQQLARSFTPSDMATWAMASHGRWAWLTVALTLTILAPSPTVGIFLQGTETSYARFPKWDACTNATFSFEFRTTQSEGLLMYADDGGRFDFFQVC